MKENRIHLSPYHYEIKTGKVNLDHFENDPNPHWHKEELSHLSRLQDESTESYFFFYYPYKETLVTNALLAGLSIVSQDVYVNRATLDFIISHMPITSQINTSSEFI